MFQFSVGLVVFAVFLTITASVGLLLLRRITRRMGIREFVRRLLRARGVRTTTARQLSVRLASDAPPLVVDLREPSKRSRGVIPKALTVPFDDFLREVVVDGRFAEDKARPLVLVCDHGNVSRVAGDLLAEDEGFTQVSSVRGGMSAWYRLQRSKQRASRGCDDLQRRGTGAVS